MITIRSMMRWVISKPLNAFCAVNDDSRDKAPHSSEIVLVIRRFYPSRRAKILGNNLGNEFFKKPHKLPKSPANGLSASRSFSFAGSSDCEEFRRGQKLKNSHFESAAYANFATPAAQKTN